MSQRKANVRQLVHTPADMASAHLEWARAIQADPGIQFGVSAIDQHVIPMRPGNLVCVLGRPGHGKTSLMAYLANVEAKRIEQRGAKGEAVIYVTWEQAAEELDAFFQSGGDYSISDVSWGRVDLDTLMKKAVGRASIPIWIIGHGIGRAGQAAPRMTTEVILSAVESMEEDYGVRPTLALFDYMQLIPSKSYRDRVQQVTEVPILVKELALRLGVPAVVGVQARREVDDRRDKIPELRDAQWASSIEQTADKVFSLWRPAQTERIGDIVRLGERQLEVNERLFILRMLKQRGDAGRHTWALHFSMKYLQLYDLEIHQVVAPELEF